jgi:hypothetical protein
MEIFISHNTPSSKNSKIWTGKFLVHSKSTQKYIKETELEWVMNAKVFKGVIHEYPIRCSFKFIRGSKHKFDYVNAAQICLDLMSKYGWIEDDNADVIVPYFEKYEYDKENPGVYINIL